MSYSFSVPDGTLTGFRDRAEQAFADYKAHVATHGGTLVDEVDGDVDAAINAATELVERLRGDDLDAAFTVGISGHANAGREAPQGWASDSITVYVSRVRVEPPADADDVAGAGG